MEYQQFLQKKELVVENKGFEPVLDLNENLFDWQKDIVVWALRKGRACLFEDCGLGKTIQQLEWARHVHHHTNKPVLILCPLAVSQQTYQEGKKFGIDIKICQSQDDVENTICLTNYEKLHKFNASAFEGVVLDESSILKNMSGKIRNQIIDTFHHTPFKLSCSATPSPNDYMELGNHAEFMNIMTHSEMLSMFFVNDSGDVGQWRLKKHAEEEKFWKWVCSWAIMITKPSDLGYSDDGFVLPELKYYEHKLPSKTTNQGFFTLEAKTLSDRQRARRETVQQRCKYTANLINQTDHQWTVWCGLNDESRLLTQLIDGAEEVAGSTDESERERIMLGFADKKVSRIVTKPSIAGFGMNWQNCQHMVFVGLSDSWEQFYQASRRLWRFGQKGVVHCHIVIEEREGNVLQNIKRKDKQATRMIARMAKYAGKYINMKEQSDTEKLKRKMKLPIWIN